TQRVWEAATGAPAFPSFDQGYPVIHAVFFPDGSRVASVIKGPNARNVARVLDVSARKEQVVSPEWKSRLTWISVSPDGRTLSSSAEDGSVQVWAWRSTRSSVVLLQHAGPVSRVTFHPDGRRILTACAD